jgi:hypothetical protein
VADLDALASDLAEGLMRWRARSITRREAQNEVGDVADLTDDERETLVGMVLERIEHADIDITINGG